MRTSLRSLTAVAVGVFLFTHSASALELRRSENPGSRVVIGPDEVIDDNVIMLGDTLVVEGTVTGNLIAFGSRVEFSGDVRGDLLTGAETIEASGTVGGNLITFSRVLNSAVLVQGSSATFAQSLDHSGDIAGDLAAFASDLTLSGPVGNDAFVFAGSAITETSIGGNLRAWSNNVHVRAPSAVGGDLTVHASDSDQIVIDPAATVTGTTRTENAEATPQPSRYMQPNFYMAQLRGFVAALVTGLLLYWLFPSLFGWRASSAIQVGTATGVGFLLLVATPVAALLISITMIGLPVGLMTFAVWGGAIYLAKVVLAPAIGVLIVKKEPSTSVASFAAVLAAGLAVFWLLRLIPMLGPVVSFVVVVVGMGVLGLRVYAMRQSTASA